jgi:hypothetical protein
VLDGFAAPNYIGRTVQGFAASPILESSIGVRLFDGIHLRLAGSIGCIRPQTVVHFAGRNLGDWGCPLASAGGDLSIDWP